MQFLLTLFIDLFACVSIDRSYTIRRDLLRATAVTLGWKGEYRNKSLHRKLTLEKTISPAAPAGTRTRDLSITSPTLLTTELAVPAPAHYES